MSRVILKILRIFSLPKPVCLNEPSHRPYWNARWNRELCLDHVNVTEITLFNAYCKKCHETISYWPEFVMPYQRKPLETHEQVVIGNLKGISLRESAAKIGYDPGTLSRWLKLIVNPTKSPPPKKVGRFPQTPLVIVKLPDLRHDIFGGINPPKYNCNIKRPSDDERERVAMQRYEVIAPLLKRPIPRGAQKFVDDGQPPAIIQPPGIAGRIP